jgi:pimeloyl-ACP methyl ester carboxylesterase
MTGTTGGVAGSAPAAATLPTILLLHGALGDGAQLAPLVTRLTTRAELVVPTLEGHGADAPGEHAYRIERFADAMLAALDRAGHAAPVHVFGYSLGGYVGLWLARHAPTRVASVFTLGTKLAWSPAAAEQETRQLDAAQIRARVPKFAALLERRHGAARWERVLDRTAEMMRHMGQHPTLGDEDFAAIACPVRVAVGDRDATVSVDEAARVARTLPAGELEVLPRTPHPIERASWDRLAMSVLEFVTCHLTPVT